jgi:hypothetical protein
MARHPGRERKVATSPPAGSAGRDVRNGGPNVASLTLSSDESILAVRIPFAIKKRGGRKQVILPDGLMPPPVPQKPNSALVKAIARAFRWRDLLESGAFETIGELAKAERINPSFVSRTLRLSLLPPELVEKALDGRCEADVRQMMSAVLERWGERPL